MDLRANRRVSAIPSVGVAQGQAVATELSAHPKSTALENDPGDHKTLDPYEVTASWTGRLEFQRHFRREPKFGSIRVRASNALTGVTAETRWR